MADGLHSPAEQSHQRGSLGSHAGRSSSNDTTRPTKNVRRDDRNKKRDIDDEPENDDTSESTGVHLPQNTGVTPTVAELMDNVYGPRIRSNMHPRQRRTYEHLHPLFHTIMTQYHVNRGLKIFGIRGEEAVLKELHQLHVRKVMAPTFAKELTPEQRQAALQYLMFLKEKRSGVIKGHGCADGRPQRLHMTKEESSSPTVAIESVILSCVIDALEGRDVATVDIPGAFMQADMDEEVHIKLEGPMADILIKLDPKFYSQYVVIENGKRVIYAVLLKALYGTLRAALLFWQKLTAQLKEWGFKINPYDWCVANKVINGKQCTICWHIDDLKISHVDADVVTNVIEHLDNAFGKEAPITVHRGKHHDYLGVDLDFSIPGQFRMSMFKYIEDMLTELPQDMNGMAMTPAGENLFDTRPDNERVLLDNDTKEFFHHNTAKLLFLSRRARPDIQLAVSFLTTRVQSPDVDDYRKLRRCMQYLRATKDLPLTLEANNLHLIRWFADASYAVHPDLRSHTGGAMTLGKGAIYNLSCKQRLNTKSSTEAEVVGADDILPQLLWTSYFMEAQGYPISDAILHQDNESAMRLERNGRASSTKRTKHIDVRYFFITDRIKQGQLRVEYCSTDEMWADFHTKPLQGRKFIYFRNLIMNSPGYGEAETSASPQECVGTNGSPST